MASADAQTMELSISRIEKESILGIENSSTVTYISKGDLTGMMLHSPSEHTLNGEMMDAEIQYFYKDTNGKQGALAVFYDLAEGGDVESALIKSLLSTSAKETIKFSAANVNANIWNDKSEWVVYAGSFTTPKNAGVFAEKDTACMEDVTWAILGEVQPISAGQQTSLLGLWANNSAFNKVEGNGNNRKVVENNGRKIFSNKVMSGSGAQ